MQNTKQTDMQTPTTPLLKNIKNIVFDLGNVLVDIDFNRTVEAFQKLGNDNLDLNLDNYMDHPIFGAIEKGQITTAEFRDRIREMLDSEVSDEEVDKAWAAVIINSDSERIELLKRLKSKYRIFILSNTDEIHITRALKIFKDNFDVDFTSLFEKCYYSHEMGMEKPDAKIYLEVLNDAKLIPEETLFIDDKLENIEAANLLNIKGHHHLHGEEKLVDLFC